MSRADALAAEGSALYRQGRLADAEARYRETLALDPLHPAGVRNLGVVLVAQARYGEALSLADQTLAAAPELVEALLVRGNALSGLGRFDEAAAAYGAALDLRPDDPFARFRRGVARLTLGAFETGWADYAARWANGPFLEESAGPVPPSLVPGLSTPGAASDLAGRRVLVVGEQGIGDQVMFASMIPDLARVAAEVTVICDQRLARLFGAAFPEARVSGPKQASVRRDAVDLVVAMGDLGRAFRRRRGDFPGGPYLAPTPPARARWAERLGPRAERLRVGLAWRGGTPQTRGPARSVGLDALAPVLALPGIEFVSLQHRPRDEELAGRPLRAFADADLQDFDDLAGLVANLDLVVSVQTAAVHLAGALGVDCLAMVPAVPEWRYGAAGEAMPWYGSVRLCRQGAEGDWAPVVGQVVDALRRL